MTWFLVTLFLTAGGGVEIKEGWYPLQMPNECVCGESVEKVIAYLDSIGADAVAYCRGTPTQGDNV